MNTREISGFVVVVVVVVDCAVLPCQIQILHVWLEIQVFLYLLNIKKEMEITYINLQQILGWISDFVRSFFAGAFFKRKMNMDFTVLCILVTSI